MAAAAAPNAQPLSDSFQQLLDETDDAGEASVTYWNYGLSEFANAPDAPDLDDARSGQGSAEEGQITVLGEPL